MINLLDLLDRFSKSLNKDLLIKELIIKIIKEKTKVSLNPDNLSLKDGVLQINSSSTAKNEISLKELYIKENLASKKIFISRFLYK